MRLFFALIIFSVCNVATFAIAREKVPQSKPQTNRCQSILEGDVEMKCEANGYVVDIRIGKNSAANASNRNYRSGVARVSFSGSDVLPVQKDIEYSGDAWAITINVPGRSSVDYSQLLFMFGDGGHIRAASLIRHSRDGGQKIIPLTCQH